MSVDLHKVSILVRGVDALLGLRGEQSILNESLVDELIQQALSFAVIKFSPEEIEAVRRNVTWKYKIYTTPGESILLDYEQENWYDKIKPTVVPRFWERYKDYLIDEKGFSPNVVSVLGDATLDEKLMNYIGDPLSENGFLRRGLIIGDVQSGKTSTYIGFMCKAADAGYRVFMLLTGTIESLRKQTQERVEEGFVGIDMSADSTGGKRVGVGLDNKDIMAMAMTSQSTDFVGKIDKLAVSLKNKEAIVFVIKKNPTVLKKIKDWLVLLNADPITKKINIPMILIDDEADNASINTSASKEDPTRINGLIRELVDVFDKSNYVGFTATPFANVFIDPETTDEMENHDLFPEDFIVSLPTPSNYIGPMDIFSETGNHYSQLRYVEDAGRYEEDGWPFYFSHQKTWDGSLPESLTDAIYAFYLANAIRDLRGDKAEHRSMLINISRFIAVQQKIKKEVERIHNAAYRSIKFNLSSKFNESMKDPVLKRIHEQWEKNYSGTEFAWSDVADSIFGSIESIQIRIVNSSKASEKLEYPKNDSLRVIAIGGLALSRGLTLEGLVVSYFYRNTCTYDVLMQMGRWFGYRRGYDDLFRIWTHRDSASWYAEIAEATQSLKDDMGIMRDYGLKPKDFGIRVRNNSDDLSITAKNKMRNAKDEYEFLSYFGCFIETPYLSSDVKTHISNFASISSFVKTCIDKGFTFAKEKSAGGGEHHIIKNISKYRIIELLQQIQISRFNAGFDTKQISDFLNDSTEKSLDKWDIAFMDGSNTGSEVPLSGETIYKVARKTCRIDPRTNRLSIGRKGKLGGPNDGIMGVTDPVVVMSAKAAYREYYEKKYPGSLFSEDKAYASNTWFKFINGDDRHPLLIVYFVDVTTNESGDAEQILRLRDGLKDIPVTAFAIGIPRDDAASVVSKNKYKANKYYNWFEQDDILAEEVEE